MCARVCVCGACVCVCARVLMHVHTRVLTHTAVGGMQNGAKINWIRLISLGKQRSSIWSGELQSEGFDLGGGPAHLDEAREADAWPRLAGTHAAGGLPGGRAQVIRRLQRPWGECVTMGRGASRSGAWRWCVYPRARREEPRGPKAGAGPPAGARTRLPSSVERQAGREVGGPASPRWRPTPARPTGSLGVSLCTRTAHGARAVGKATATGHGRADVPLCGP